MFNKKLFLYFDYALFIFVIALAIFGTVVIGSATKINIYGESPQFTGQIMWLIAGVVLMLVFTFVDYHFIAKFYIPIYALNMFLLVIVLFAGSGDGVSRWVFGIQPSEFSKLFMIIFLAKIIDKYQDRINSLPILFMIALSDIVPAVLIKIQPSLSASLVTLMLLAAMLFAGKLSFKYIGIVALILIPIIILLVIDILSGEHIILGKFLKTYQLERIDGAINLDLTGNDQATYQTRHSIWAIGSGQLKGKGLYNGTINQLNYLPYSQNDFIFAVVGEEFGFVGCVGVLTVMLVIIIKIIFTAIKAMDNLGALMAVGVASMFAFQTFVNVGVATGLLPNTGMAFPLLSYGGSAMIVNMICIGLVLNVGLRKPKSMFER
jgi:rod shape determining protein RodA